MLCLAGGLNFFPAQKTMAQEVSISFQAFYDGLSPYGTWINYPAYGYVWVPTAVPHGFRPYVTGGHWVYTDDGWLWVSDYEWGWAPFHYGNWFYDESYGWLWAPGYEWAPAWVTWGEYEGSYCWAPIAPHLTVSIVAYRPPHYYWNFCPRERITSPRIYNYTRVNNATVINNITVINNVHQGGGGRVAFMRGPQPQNVERYTHTAVRPVQVRASARPGRAQIQSGQVAIYRPVVNRGNARPAPSHTQDMHSLRTSTLPAVNRNVQPNIHTDNGRTRPNANPGNNPAFNERAPANNKPASPRPSNPPVEKRANPSNPSHNNRPSMNNLPSNNNRHPAPAPANRPVTPPNHNTPNPATTRPNVQPQQHPAPQQRPVQQSRPPAANPQPAHNPPPHPEQPRGREREQR